MSHTQSPCIQIPWRVRYVECDPMGLVHHSVYPAWFEQARTELLRSRGINYADLERQGIFIVVARLNVSYRKPARYDQQLSITATLRRVSAAKIEHDYQVHCGDTLLCTASTTLACVDREGRVQAIPRILRFGHVDD